jgi:hypothetical protein
MQQKKIVTARNALLSARAFNIGSIIAALIPILVPIWFAGSIFTYAAVAHHPDLRVREYNRWAGYRFYGVVGTFVMVLNFTGELKEWLGGAMHMWMAVWAIIILVIVPAGIWAFIKAGREDWKDIELELDHA